MIIKYHITLGEFIKTKSGLKKFKTALIMQDRHFDLKRRKRVHAAL